MNTYVEYGSFKFLSENGYPVPNFSIAQTQNRTSAGAYLSSERVVTLEGIVYTQKMVAQNSTGTSGTSDITTLFAKASGLKSNIIANNMSGLKIGYNTKNIVDGSGLLKSISFQENENYWTNTINYTIEIAIPITGSMLQADTAGANYHVSNVQDECRLEVIEDQTYLYNSQYLPAYRISRTLGATGKSVDVSGALVNAKKWVNFRQDNVPLTGMFPSGDFPLYNPSRNVSVDEVNGTYTVTETFISKSGDPWIITNNINLSKNLDNIRQVEINGKIQGLQKYTFNEHKHSIINGANIASGMLDIKPEITGLSSTNYKYLNAVSGYSSITGQFYQVAVNKDNILKNYESNNNTAPINPIPLSVTEGFNPTEGSISYTRTYNNRRISIISGALVETINIRESKPVNSVGEVFVIGRRLGPIILSNTRASGIGTKTVSYEGVFPRPTGLPKYNFPKDVRDRVNTFISGLAPTSPSIGFIKEDTENLNLTENRLSRTVTWEFTTCNN